MTKYEINQEFFNDSLQQYCVLQTEDYNLYVSQRWDDPDDMMVPVGVAYEVRCHYKYSDSCHPIYLDNNYKILNPDDGDIDILIKAGIATSV